MSLFAFSGVGMSVRAPHILGFIRLPNLRLFFLRAMQKLTTYHRILPAIPFSNQFRGVVPPVPSPSRSCPPASEFEAGFQPTSIPHDGKPSSTSTRLCRLLSLTTYQQLYITTTAVSQTLSRMGPNRIGSLLGLPHPNYSSVG